MNFNDELSTVVKFYRTQVYKDSKLEDESRTRCGSALQLILNECNDYDVLEKLLTPSFTTDIIAYVLRQISKVYLK